MKKLINIVITSLAAVCMAVGIHNIWYCFNRDILTIQRILVSVSVICTGLGIFSRKVFARKVALIGSLWMAIGLFWWIYGWLNLYDKTVANGLLGALFFLFCFYFLSHHKVKEYFK